ncbi:MAG: hypothetical protein J6B81_02785 [Spirochaetaceae bacterium]|nr:hypothetical protein [Spirochaetaceae bacterium]
MFQNKNARFILMMYIILNNIGCSFISFDDLRVTCSIESQQNFFLGERIEVFFSKSMEFESVNSNIILKRENRVVEAEITGEGTTFFVKPHVPWEYGVGYQIIVNGTLLSREGGSYNVLLQRSFIYGKEGSELYLVQSYIPDSTLVSLSKPLIFTFNKAVDTASFIENFNITPYCQTNIFFNDSGTSVSVYPSSSWNINNRYTWSISDIIAADGYAINRNYSGTFCTFTDVDLPLLTTVCPVSMGEEGDFFWRETSSLDGSLKDREAIGFIFSKPMDIETLKLGISFSPTAKGQLVQDKNNPFRVIWIPLEPWKIQTEYEVKIDSTVADTTGLKLFDSNSCFFTTFNNYMSIAKVDLGSTTIVQFPSYGEQYVLNQSGEEKKCHLRIWFSSAIPKEKRISAIKAISLESFFPVTVAEPILEQVQWIQDGFAVELTWSGLSESSMDVECFYRLYVSSGQEYICNEAEEYLEEDVCIIFKAI